ncbi:MAG: FAD-dependent oxidoreductase, partial [candidate division KSB1 bacterium]|nr:FAD-dependent oxidoreductase [candidate division KSB1 bacterium]
AGGIGITPFISMLRYINEESLNYKITLIYSNSDRASTPFLEELQNMAKKNPSFKLILTMTQDPEWEGEKRRVEANREPQWRSKPTGAQEKRTDAVAFGTRLVGSRST